MDVLCVTDATTVPLLLLLTLLSHSHINTTTSIIGNTLFAMCAFTVSGIVNDCKVFFLSIVRPSGRITLNGAIFVVIGEVATVAAFR